MVYLAVTVAVIGLHLHESGQLHLRGLVRLAARPALATLAVSALVLSAVAMRGEQAARALLPPEVWDGLVLTAEDLPLRLGGGIAPWLVPAVAALLAANWAAVAMLARQPELDGGGEAS